MLREQQELEAVEFRDGCWLLSGDTSPVKLAVEPESVAKVVQSIPSFTEKRPEAGRSGIFPSERDFRIWKQKQDDARVERFLNARLIAGEPYDRSRNSICEECRNSDVMQRVLAFYRGYQQGAIGE
ncbi:DUF977 family protein [Salmonella enterica]|nr:DUF977 family protein [Salmonella enterica]EGL7477245.1 DUF977 family protein [Salmonella enterica]EIZ2336013.1 DUF977 family protein [Salmonella enterica]